MYHIHSLSGSGNTPLPIGKEEKKPILSANKNHSSRTNLFTTHHKNPTKKDKNFIQKSAINTPKRATHDKPYEVKINLHPEGANPVEYYKSIGVSGTEMIHFPILGKYLPELCLFTSNFLGTGQPGLLLHGDDEGEVSLGLTYNKNSEKISKDNSSCSIDKLRELLEKKEIDLKKLVKANEPLHFISCFATTEQNDRPSIAQVLADSIQRTVIAYAPPKDHKKPYYSVIFTRIIMDKQRSVCRVPVIKSAIGLNNIFFTGRLLTFRKKSIILRKAKAYYYYPAKPGEPCLLKHSEKLTVNFARLLKIQQNYTEPKPSTRFFSRASSRSASWLSTKLLNKDRT